MSHVQEFEMRGGRAFDHAAPMGGAVDVPEALGLPVGDAAGPGEFDTLSASADLVASGLTVEASVKWFSAAKGYGFVELAGGLGDAFLHLKTLRETGRQTLPSGVKIRAIVRAGARGAEVVRVIEIDAGSAGERSLRHPTLDPSTAFELTGKVKWFDCARGFGFVASDDFGRDVFVHSSTLGALRVTDLYEGQRVSMRVVQTPKGREAIAIIV